MKTTALERLAEYLGYSTARTTMLLIGTSVIIIAVWVLACYALSRYTVPAEGSKPAPVRKRWPQ